MENLDHYNLKELLSAHLQTEKKVDINTNYSEHLIDHLYS